MTPLRMIFTVLALAIAGSTVAAWEWLTGPVIPRPSAAALLSPAPAEPDFEAQLAALRQRLDRHDEALGDVARRADAAQNAANARERAHALLEADHYRLAGEVATLSKEAARNDPRARTKARRAPPPPQECPSGGKRP